MNDQSVAESLRLIIAEDHAATRDTLAFLLQRHGYEVAVASDGRSAQALLAESHGPTIALLDWMLPEMTGLSICRQWQHENSNHFVYFIILTARDSMEDLKKAFDAGADDFIRKPCDPTELLARIRVGQRIVELEHRLSARVVECEAAVEHIRQLKRLLPICMYCKKVRDDSEYWREIESYLHEQAGTDFSHGICPECMDVVSAGLEPGISRKFL
jgi:CheY-like chemotaxis protein